MDEKVQVWLYDMLNAIVEIESFLRKALSNLKYTIHSLTNDFNIAFHSSFCFEIPFLYFKFNSAFFKKTFNFHNRI